ncbi:hypothetical protein J2P12_05160 [Candidatus Bathyarchaeota archaeon]|nr:hypothetical protein [Candidatus Bathyarchaeota archaeon]
MLLLSSKPALARIGLSIALLLITLSTTGPHLSALSSNPPNLGPSLTLASPSPQYFGEFGLATAVSGQVAIIGAYLEQDNGVLGAGHAYIYNTTTGTLLHILTSPNSQYEGWFGFSVAIDGNLAVVGAMDETVAGARSAGHAYVYNTVTGELVQTLTSPTPQRGYFGHSVAISGNTAVVGASEEPSEGQGYAGNVYMYNAQTGSLVRTLTSPNPVYFGLFGNAVATSGKIIIIGAPYETSRAQPEAGHAYLYDAQTGTLLQTLASPKALQFGFFGTSVATDGNIAVIGAPDEPSQAGIGSAYVFRVSTGSLTRVLASPNAVRGAQFGTSVATSGGSIVVGAPGEAPSRTFQAGHAYIFDALGGKIISLTSPSVQPYGVFGNSVSMSGSTALVGADGEAVAGQVLAGHVYVYSS